MEWRFALPEVKGARIAVQGTHGETVFSASAYDVPRVVTVNLDRTASTLRVEFGYPDKEEATTRRVEKDVDALIGVNSGKLLGFVFRDVPRTPGQLVFGLQQAVDNQLAGATRMNQRLNFQTIQSMVHETAVREQLERALAGT